MVGIVGVAWWAIGWTGGCARDEDLVCCSDGASIGWATSDAACGDLGGDPVEPDVCDGLPTDHVFATSSEPPSSSTPTPTPSSTTPPSRSELCAAFCAAEQSVCPTDTACVHSCEVECPTGPSEQDVACAEAAADAAVACGDFDCWGFCS